MFRDIYSRPCERLTEVKGIQINKVSSHHMFIHTTVSIRSKINRRLCIDKFKIVSLRVTYHLHIIYI